MSRLLSLYFSGTGNTEYVAKKVASELNYEYKSIVSIESDVKFDEMINNADDILIAYPIYGGTMPIIVRRFLDKYGRLFKGKGLITVITQAGSRATAEL